MLFTINQIIYFKLLEWLKLLELSMAMVLGSVEDERYFFNLSFYQKQIEKLVDSPFGSCGVDVCTKLLHYQNFHVYYNYQILGPTKIN
jgi:hypothetical protein